MRKSDMFQFIRFFLAVVLLLGLEQVFVSAAPKSDQKTGEEVPPWMEKVDRAKGSSYLIPKGAKVEEVTSGFVKIEPPAEYVARQVFELQERQADMEKELKAIKSELEELREQCALAQQNSDEKAP